MKATHEQEARQLQRYMPCPATGCWLWEGRIDKNGYGKLRIDGEGKRIEQRAHRVAYKHEHGSVPDGMHVLHRCDVPSCINPSHLFAGTDLDNVIDCVRKGRNANALKTHCKYGHAFDDANARTVNKATGSKARACRVCLRVYMRAYDRGESTAEGLRAAAANGRPPVET